MTVLADIPELALIGAFDRGVPNKERVVLKPNQLVDIGSYMLVAGIRTSPPPNNFIAPLRDHLFWFGSAFLGPDDWIFAFTGHGAPSRFPSAVGPGQIYTVYWNRTQTIFHDPQVVPALVRINGIVVEPRPQAAEQPPHGFLTQSVPENS